MILKIISLDSLEKFKQYYMLSKTKSEANNCYR